MNSGIFIDDVRAVMRSESILGLSNFDLEEEVFSNHLQSYMLYGLLQYDSP